MTASMLRRSARRHSKRSPSFLGTLADEAREGDFGPLAQQLADHVSGDDKPGNGNSGNNNGANNGKKNGNKFQTTSTENSGTGGINNNSPPPSPPPPDSGPGPTSLPQPNSNPVPAPPSTPPSNNPGSGGPGDSASPGPGGSASPGPGNVSGSSEDSSAPSIPTPTHQDTESSNSTPTGSSNHIPSPGVSAPVETVGYGSQPSNPSGASLNPSPTQTDTDPVAATSGQNNRGAIAGGVIGALLLICLVFGAWIIYKRRRKNRLPPSAEFMNSPPTYPFAGAGFGNGIFGKSEKSGPFANYFGGLGTGAAGQTKFNPLNITPGENLFLEKARQIPQYRDEQTTQALPRPPPLEVLYSTPQPNSTTAAAPTGPDSVPGTPTTPNGRRIPFGTGTFQFPPPKFPQ